MSNIVITSTADTIEINYGDYSSAINVSKSSQVKANIRAADLMNGNICVELSINATVLPLSYQATQDAYIVDSIDGAVPTSNADLYNKLVALMGSQEITQIDEASETITYVGKAVAGSSGASAVWSISRIDTSTLPQTIIKWADGNTFFDNIWNNRVSLSYS